MRDLCCVISMTATDPQESDTEAVEHDNIDKLWRRDMSLLNENRPEFRHVALQSVGRLQDSRVGSALRLEAAL